MKPNRRTLAVGLIGLSIFSTGCAQLDEHRGAVAGGVAGVLAFGICKAAGGSSGTCAAVGVGVGATAALVGNYYDNKRKELEKIDQRMQSLTTEQTSLQTALTTG